MLGASSTSNALIESRFLTDGSVVFAETPSMEVHSLRDTKSTALLTDRCEFIACPSDSTIVPTRMLLGEEAGGVRPGWGEVCFKKATPGTP